MPRLISTLLEGLQELLEMAAERRGIHDPGYGGAGKRIKGDYGGDIRGKKAGKGERPANPTAWYGVTPEEWPEAFSPGGHPKVGSGMRDVKNKVMQKLTHLMSQYADADDLELSDVEKTALEQAARGKASRAQARLVASVAARAAQFVYANPSRGKNNNPVPAARLFVDKEKQILAALARNPAGRGFSDWHPDSVPPAALKRIRAEHTKVVAALKRAGITWKSTD